MYIFIINPTSGKGNGLKVWRKVEQKLKESQITYLYLLTEKQGDGTNKTKKGLAQVTHDEVKGVIAIGGDGTVHEVVNGLRSCENPPPFGFIPAGSGNDFALALSLGNWEEALHIVLTGAPKLLDLGIINEKHYFIDTAGAGFDGEVTHYSNHAFYKKWFNLLGLGKVTYILSLIRMLFTYRKASVKLKVDGVEQVWERVWMVVVGNIKSFGGGMKICPDALPDDGKFQICIVHSLSPLNLLFVFPKVYKGTHKGHPAVELFDAQTIDIEFEQPIHFQMDGEVKGKTPIAIKIIPRGINVLLPF